VLQKAVRHSNPEQQSAVTELLFEIFGVLLFNRLVQSSTDEPTGFRTEGAADDCK
jgi:hypothetical protein